MQCHTRQGFGQQRAALPNKLRRYARMHTCNPWPVLEHMAPLNACLTTHHFYLLGIQWRASPVRDDNSHSAKARICLILALPTRESPWGSKASRRPPSQEWRTRRRELFRLGAEKEASSDCKTFFPSQTTQQQCCSSSLEGRSNFTSPANHTTWEAKSKLTMLQRTWLRFFGLMRDSSSWPAPRWWRAAPQQASWFEGAHAPHIMNIPLSMRIKDPVWSHSNETRPSFAVLV